MDTDLDDYEQRLTRRRRLGLVLRTVLALAIFVPLLGWRGYRLYESLSGPGEPPEAARVTIDKEERIAVSGCAEPVADCLSRIHSQEYRRPGGGHYRVGVYPEPGAPREAVDRVIAAAYRAELLPQEHLPN